jgi:hypothetical protein
MLAGYDIIAQIYKGRHSAIFRALRSRDQQPVILKTPITDFPLARIIHESQTRSWDSLRDVL